MDHDQLAGFLVEQRVAARMRDLAFGRAAGGVDLY
jgi:hypothetical protein